MPSSRPTSARSRPRVCAPCFPNRAQFASCIGNKRLQMVIVPSSRPTSARSCPACSNKQLQSIVSTKRRHKAFDKTRVRTPHTNAIIKKRMQNKKRFRIERAREKKRGRVFKNPRPLKKNAVSFGSRQKKTRPCSSKFAAAKKKKRGLVTRNSRLRLPDRPPAKTNRGLPNLNAACHFLAF